MHINSTAPIRVYLRGKQWRSHGTNARLLDFLYVPNLSDFVNNKKLTTIFVNFRFRFVILLTLLSKSYKGEMAAEDALNVVKQAALQALIDDATNLKSETDSSVLQPSTLERKSSSRTRRRKRKRVTTSVEPSLNLQEKKGPPSTLADVSDDEIEVKAETPTIEYEPEPLDEAVKRARVSKVDAAQVLDVFIRFERRAQKSDPSLQLDRDDPPKDIGDQSSKQRDNNEGQVKSKSDFLHLKDRKNHVRKDINNAEENGYVDGNTDAGDIAEDGGGELGTESGRIILEQGKNSRKKWKEERRNLISKLKAFAPDPSVIEAWDITAADPVLLATLKCVRNSVPVPVNWRQKRKYLQNKRGLEKRALSLPSYVEALGIGSTRDAQLEADSKKTLKQKQREKMRAKLGAVTMDEMNDQRLYDAFFKFQTKPHLSGLGDTYYELRELDVDARTFQPGVLSTALQEALGMEEGDPVPWLVGMQRWGPPPGWPGLVVPGVNAPIPDRARFGYQTGGWGKAPVDEFGRPIYGDVFNEGLGLNAKDKRFDMSDNRKRYRWGQTPDPDDDPTGLDVGDIADNTHKHDEMSSADMPRKRDASVANNKRPSMKPHDKKGISNMASRGGERDYDEDVGRGGYRVLKERRGWTADGGSMMGSSHTYDVGTSADRRGKESNGPPGEDTIERTIPRDRHARSNHSSKRTFKF